MTFIAIILVLLPLLVFILFRLHDAHRGVTLVSEEDFELARYVETHHRWIAFWMLVPGWLLAALVTIDYLHYFYAWGFFSPIFHVEYDLPESGEITLYLSWVYLALGTLWMIHNFVCISRINHSLDKLKDEIK
ncbi:MAG: hypothetical protein MJZ58_01785 [Paludibacteraceae bacterium]|nr:hypothetical protein [Paludibacteraceae bacterium]